MLECASSRYGILLFIIFLLGHPCVSLGAQTIILNITVNRSSKGDFFVKTDDGKDFLIRTPDLKTMGFRDPAGETTVIEGDEYISLKSMKGVRFTYNEDALSIEIEAPAEMLPKTTIDYMPQRNPRVIYTGREDSAFLNYRLDYIAGDSFNFQSFNLTGELGVRTHDILFLTDSTYVKTPASEKTVRLVSSITYDRRNDLQRAVIGDFFASSGELGSNVTMGGFSLSKVYRMDPYFVRQPLFNFTGLISMPSDVEVYLDGMLMRKGRFQPGEIELKNISSYSGAGNIEVVIKDPFGKERRITYPFYSTDILLKEGLSEYSYNMGFLRQKFGDESNSYGKLAFSAFHRYGFDDRLTAGLTAEAAGGILNIGPQASYLIGRAGVVSMSLSASEDKETGAGFAGSLNHSYQDQNWGARLTLKGFSRDYAVINTELPVDKSKYEAGFGVSYGAKAIGTVALDYTAVRKYQGLDKKTLTATYSVNFLKDYNLFTTYRNIREDGSVNDEYFAGLTYYPWKDTSASASVKTDRDTSSQTAQVQKNAPVGEGAGYRVSYSRTDELGVATGTLNPFGQYNSRYGIYTADYKGIQSGGTRSDTYEFTAAGGIAYVGGTIGVSRPIADSFGVVKVGRLEGVRVYNNNQEIGRTDSAGKAFVNDLSSYYDNQVSVGGNDVPINYSIAEGTRVISPAFRSGAVIEFKAARIQAITGALKIRSGARVEDAEFHEVRMTVDGAEIVFPTGRGGEFYLENVKAGRYRAFTSHGGKSCSFDFIIPENDEMIIDLGDIFCEEMV